MSKTDLNPMPSDEQGGPLGILGVKPDSLGVSTDQQPEKDHRVSDGDDSQPQGRVEVDMIQVFRVLRFAGVGQTA